MPAPSHTLYTLTLFLALSSKDAEKHSSACPSACSDEGPSRGMPATCAVRDHRHHGRLGSKACGRLLGSRLFPGGLLGAGRLRLGSFGPLLRPPTP